MRVKHYINDMDGWYSCPASGECEDVLYRDDITTCTCGANEINNYIEQLEKELAEARVEINRRDELCKKCEREYEAELARYKQGVEMDGEVRCILLAKSEGTCGKAQIIIPIIPIDDSILIGNRVRLLVMKEEE